MTKARFIPANRWKPKKWPPHSDGPHIYLSNKFRLMDANGVPYATCGISMDISKRKKAEEALVVNEQQFRELLYERTRMSQDLHDHILQSLSAVG